MKYSDPLEWVDDCSFWYKAETPFGNYIVEKEADVIGFKWRYCFVEYYDEHEGYSPTIDEAKAYCQNNWDERVQPILERAYAKGEPSVS